jgi:8-oxo-dGTP pyrophosphatase MutT (NUDIX family)
MMKLEHQHREFAAGLILFDVESGMVLLVKDSKGSWRFPSGRVEINESISDAAMRELKEETGIMPGSYTMFSMPIPLVTSKTTKPGDATKVKITALFPAFITTAMSNLLIIPHEEKSLPEWMKIADAKQRTSSSTRSACIELAAQIICSFAKNSCMIAEALLEHRGCILENGFFRTNKMD